jgi:hypothetical protein
MVMLSMVALEYVDETLCTVFKDILNYSGLQTT